MSIQAYHFWSPTCAPCKAIKPAIQDLKEEFEQVTWTSINTYDDDPEGYLRMFGVQVVPTIVIVAKDVAGNVLTTEKQSGTAIVHYYRIIRNAIRTISS